MKTAFVASAAEPINTDWISLEMAALQGFIIAFLVFLNGFFVAAEFGIVKARGSQLDALAARGDKRAERASKIAANLDAYLSATQLGITLASLGLGWVGEPFLAHMLHPLFLKVGLSSETVIASVSLTLAFTIITVLHIVLGELAPKSLAIRKSVATTLWVSKPLNVFYVVFRPAIWVLNGMANWTLKVVFRVEPVAEHELAHDEEELRLIIADSARAHMLSSRGTDISLKALGLRRRVAREVLTPRRDVVFLDPSASFSENLSRAKKSGHTRFPLCDEHLDQAAGLIHIKDMISLEGDAAPVLHAIRRELPTVPEMISLEKLLGVFQENRAHMALVLDEFGGAVGIVTLDNVIEELVGEIQDEFDAETPSIERLGEGAFLLKGELSLHEVCELTGLDLESAEVSTLGGYVTEQLGRFPQIGEKVRLGQYDATVVRTEGRRVMQVRFQKVAPEPSPVVEQ